VRTGLFHHDITKADKLIDSKDLSPKAIESLIYLVAAAASYFQRRQNDENTDLLFEQRYLDTVADLIDALMEVDEAERDTNELN